MNSSLKAVAYRMLGSVSDAEDVVQEAYLKLHLAEPRPDSEQAFLYRVVSNLCIDRLRAEQTRRKYYSGPWLPDPWVEDDAQVAEMAQQLSLGFMLLLEQLSPAQRVTYVLREAFGLQFTEIADILGISEASARQHGARGRARVNKQLPPVTVPEEQRQHLESLLMAVAQGDVQGVADLLAEDAVALTDGGGVVSAAVRPVHGRQRIAQVTLHLAQKSAREGELTFEFRDLNGGPALVVTQHGRVHSCFQVEVWDGRISRIYVMRNPYKLARLRDQ